MLVPLGLVALFGCDSGPEIEPGHSLAAAPRSATVLPINRSTGTPGAGLVTTPTNACPQCLEKVTATFDARSESVVVEAEASIPLEVLWDGELVGPETTHVRGGRFHLPVPGALLSDARSAPRRFTFKLVGGDADASFHLAVHACLDASTGEPAVLDLARCSDALSRRPEAAVALAVLEKELAEKGVAEPIALLGVTEARLVNPTDEASDDAEERTEFHAQ